MQKSDILEIVYRDVVKFEASIRSALGDEFATMIPQDKIDYFASRLEDVFFGENTSENKLSHIRLIDEALSLIAPKYPVTDLHILWPAGRIAEEKIAFLADQSCNQLSTIARYASNQRNLTLTPPNKFKF